MFLYTMRNPDNVHGLIGIAAAPDFTEALWKGLSKEEKQDMKRTGIYKLRTPYSEEPYDVTMDLIQDGSKYSIMDMPGEKEWGGREGGLWKGEGGKEGRRAVEGGRIIIRVICVKINV